jgi:hypothetical protein
MTQPLSGPPAPPPHQWYAAPVPPPVRPPTSLTRPLVWTAFFTGVGIALLVALLALLALMLVLFICLLVWALGGDTSEFWSGPHDGLGPMALDVLPVLAVVSVVALAISGGVLLAYRLADGFRRWPAVLQGLSAAGTTYVGAITLGWLAQLVTGR